jgi:hypothetical protein
MRPDRQKLDATQHAGMKDEAKDLENDRQPQAASKQGHESKKAGQGHVLRRDGDSGETGTPRTNP